MAARRFNGRRFARRLRLRARRGLGLFEVVLALAVAGIAILGVNSWIEIQHFHARDRDAGRTVAVLADAARMHAQGDYESLFGLAAGRSIALSTLRDEGVLPANFDDVDEMKRDLAVVALQIPDGPDDGTQPDGVRVLAGQAPDAADDRWPHAALTQGRAEQRLGMVQTGTVCGGPTHCLVGPGVHADISAFDGRHGLTLREGAVMVLYEYAHEDFCGAFVHRVETAICADANVMEQPLTIEGRLLNAAVIGPADSLTVRGALSVRGKLTTGAMTAGGRMTVGTGMTVGGDATIDGTGDPTNPACENPASPSALCSEDRVIVGETLTVLGTADVEGPPHVDSFFTAAGGIQVPDGCIDVNGTARIAGNARVSRLYDPLGAGSCP